MNIQNLIKVGSIQVGDELIWNRRSLGVQHLARVVAGGFIQTTDGHVHRTPSGAAKHLNGNKPVDGWIAWKSKKVGKSLAELRSQIS